MGARKSSRRERELIGANVNIGGQARGVLTSQSRDGEDSALGKRHDALLRGSEARCFLTLVVLGALRRRATKLVTLRIHGGGVRCWRVSCIARAGHPDEGHVGRFIPPGSSMVPERGRSRMRRLNAWWIRDATSFVYQFKCWLPGPPTYGETTNQYI